jgi:hypothetical protein
MTVDSNIIQFLQDIYQILIEAVQGGSIYQILIEAVHHPGLVMRILMFLSSQLWFMVLR